MRERAHPLRGIVEERKPLRAVVMGEGRAAAAGAFKAFGAVDMTDADCDRTIVQMAMAALGAAGRAVADRGRHERILQVSFRDWRRQPRFQLPPPAGREMPP